MAQRERGLRSVLDELLTTEANYRNDLRFIMKEFYTPLQQLMSRATHNAIFSNLAQVPPAIQRKGGSCSHTERAPSPSPWLAARRSARDAG